MVTPQPRNAAQVTATVIATPSAAPKSQSPPSRTDATPQVTSPHNAPMMKPTVTSAPSTARSRSGWTSPVANARTRIVEDWMPTLPARPTMIGM